MPSFEDRFAAEIDTKWREFSTAATRQGAAVPSDSRTQAEIRQAFGFSRFLTRAAIRDPAQFIAVAQDGGRSPEDRQNEYAQRLKPIITPQAARTESEWHSLLRRFRHQEMVRIAWRDLTGRDDLNQTMGALSDLADACIRSAVDILHANLGLRFGQPADPDGQASRLIVVGMGKLGARELNFSSDVDLIFAFPHNGRTQGNQNAISNEDFFTRLSRALMKALGQATADGIVFRVDTNLRPFGESGPLAMSFGAMERYYQSQGREWERYAWVKARTISGHARDGEALLTLLRPFVYRRYLDFGVFESLRDMKHKIAMEVTRKGLRRNIKLGAGGIREVEFFTQIFQLLRGGVTSGLQMPSLLPVLDELVHRGHIAPAVQKTLTTAYVFLRRVENRLQEYDDQQTHELPDDPYEQYRLARAMGFDAAAPFLETLDRHRQNVHAQFTRLLASDRRGAADTAPSELDPLRTVWLDAEDEARASDILRVARYQSPPEVLNRLRYLRNQVKRLKLSPEGVSRIDRLMPLFLAAAAQAPLPDQTLSRLVDILASIGKRTTYLALLVENTAVLKHLVQLAGASHFIATYLARHPVLLDELLDPRLLYAPPRRTELDTDITTTLSRIAADELEFQIESLCIFRQTNTLRIAAADVTGSLPLMQVSDYLSDLAEVILDQVLHLAWNYLVARHGQPAASLDGAACRTGFAVVAYGKLGGYELAYASDLDLVFIHAAEKGMTHGGSQPIDNAQFYARLGQRMIHILTSHTRAGKIYDTDMRLRPSGSAGPLVTHIAAFERYLKQNAWIWEHQALIRARAVCGDPCLAQAFGRIRDEVLQQPRDQPTLRRAVRSMRRRLRREHAPSDATHFDLKQGRGGIVDVEFLVQYLVLSHSHQQPALTHWTDNVRLLVTLIDSGLLTHTTAYLLREAYLTLRAAAHRLSLQDQPAVVSADRFRPHRRQVVRAWNHFMRD